MRNSTEVEEEQEEEGTDVETFRIWGTGGRTMYPCR